MDTLQVIGAIASIVTAVIAVVSIYPVFRGIRQAERSLRFDVYFRVIEMVEKTRKARHLLYDKVSSTPSPTSFSHLTTDEVEQLDELARTFDKVGLLVKYGVVPLNFVLDFYSHPIVIAWHRLEPHITAERNRRGQRVHMITFENLAIEAKKYRDKEDPGGETFALPTVLNRKWRIWHR